MQLIFLAAAQSLLPVVLRTEHKASVFAFALVQPPFVETTQKRVAAIIRQAGSANEHHPVATTNRTVLSYSSLKRSVKCGILVLVMAKRMAFSPLRLTHWIAIRCTALGNASFLENSGAVFHNPQIDFVYSQRLDEQELVGEASKYTGIRNEGTAGSKTSLSLKKWSILKGSPGAGRTEGSLFRTLAQTSTNFQRVRSSN
jgi:hypothetical protein